MKDYKGFLNSRSEHYIWDVSSKFDITKAEETAILLDKPRNFRGKEYNKFIRIDFLGVAATTLFDGAQALHSKNVYKELRNILSQIDELNKSGIFVKIRLLLEYPYSTSAFSRIRAETCTQRASMNDPHFTPNFEDPQERLDEEEYQKSFLMIAQQSVLQSIQFLEQNLRSNGIWNGTDNPNSITVRFTPINPEVCCLFMNNDLYYDVLLYSKLERQHNSFTNNSPVIKLCKDNPQEKDSFISFEDHFRYLWNHNTTLDCEDATKFQQDVPKSLSKLKKPNNIKFDNKLKRLYQSEKRPGQIRSWENVTKDELLHYCCDISVKNEHQLMFITCSWNLEEDGKTAPNNYACLLSEYFSKDFSKCQPAFSIQILQAVASEFLSNQLYEEMDKSTIGLILMTRDIEGKDGKFYCKPNVYHELGYLMKHLGKEMLIIFREKDVFVPSNIQDIIRIEFDIDKMPLRFLDVVSRISEITDIDEEIFIRCMGNHIKRLDKLVHEKKIDVDENNKAKNRIQSWITKLKNKKN
jgi:hypothetical protein